MTFSPITLGRPLRRLRTGTADVTETVYRPGQRLARHVHERPNIALVMRGRFDERCGSAQWKCRPGDVIFKPAAVEHSNDYGPEQSRCILIELRNVDDDTSLGRLLTSPLLVRDPFLTAVTYAVESDLYASDDLSDVAIEGAVLQMIARVARTREFHGSAPPRHVLIARDLLHARIGQKTTVAQLAIASGVPAGLLVRHFRRVLGASPAAYQRRLRLERACTLIASTRRSLAEIAVACGFASQSHLTDSIRSATGLTPGDLRRRSSAG